MSKRLPIGHGIFSSDVTRRPSPACRRLCFEIVFRCATQLSSDVAGNAAFLSLALSQRHFNQQGVFDVTIVKGDGEVEGPAVRYLSVSLPMPQARNTLVEGPTKSEGDGCDIVWGGIA
jgi:hypothetical protein